MNEHDYEPVRGLPARLPDGERILWQGAPHWRDMARRTFHVNKIAVYFAILVAWRFAVAVHDGGSLVEAVTASSLLVALGAAAVALLAGYAWLIARASVYTITNRRVVLRIGVALSVTINLPFKVISSAAVRLTPSGRGDIPLNLDPSERVSYALLWPHARPWRFSQPEPMLRSIADAKAVAEILSDALASADGQPQVARIDVPDTGSRTEKPASAESLQPVAG